MSSNPPSLRIFRGGYLFLWLLLLSGTALASDYTSGNTDDHAGDEGYLNADDSVYLEEDVEEYVDDEEYADSDMQWAMDAPPVKQSRLSDLLSTAHFTYRHEAAYGIDEPTPLVINRFSLRLQWEYGVGANFFRFDGKTGYDLAYQGDDYSEVIADKYLHESQLREFYWQRSDGPFSIKLGRQLVIWGKADGAVVTDVMSPRDFTESVFTSIEDARLGQEMIVMDYYHLGAQSDDGLRSQQQWSLVVTPYIKVNEQALPGHPYGRFPSAAHATSFSAEPSVAPVTRGTDSIVTTDYPPGESWHRPEVGLRWGVSRGKLDWALMAAEVNEDNPILSLASQPSPYPLRIDYPRYQMLGGGFNWGGERFVWKGEAAFKKNRHFTHEDIVSSGQYSVLDAALGFDYDANGAYSVSLELSNQHIINWSDDIALLRRDESILYGSISKNWWNETLTTTYTSMLQLQDEEFFHRFEFIYEVDDRWTIELQADYFDSDKQLSVLGQLQDKSRIALQIDFDF